MAEPALMNRFIDHQLSNAHHSAKNMDNLVYNFISDACCIAAITGNKIVISGLGKNVAIAEKFVGMLNSLGIQAAFMHTNSAMHGDLGMLTMDDVLIVMSKSGNTEETVRMVEYIQSVRPQQVMFGLSCDGGRLEELILTLVVPVTEEEPLYKTIPCASSLAFLMILQALALDIADRLLIPKDAFRVNHPGGAIGAKLCN